ncbi:hypothetical protein GmHk_17G049059 [Glycine max]|nr:hypothetical protein GmHk_17G049059 [Glycine max]
MTLKEQTEGAQNVRPSKNTLSQLIPQTKTDEIHDPPPSYSLPINVYDDDVMAQFQSCSSPSLRMLPYDSSSSCSHQQFPRYLPFQVTGFGPQGIPAMMPQYNKGHLWLHPPTLTDFPKLVQAWEVN